MLQVKEGGKYQSKQYASNLAPIDQSYVVLSFDETACGKFNTLGESLFHQIAIEFMIPVTVIYFSY